MAIFDKIKNFFHSYNKETHYGRATHFADGYFADSDQKIPLTVDEMLSLSYITKSIQMIARDVAKVHFIQKKYNSKTNKMDIVRNTRIDWLINRKPSSDLKGYDFKTILVWNLFLYQKAAIYCHYEKINDRYYLTELIPIYPEYIRKCFDDNGKLYYEVFINAENKEPLKLLKEQIIWMEYCIINNVNNVSFSALFKSTLSKLKENENAIYNAIKNDTGISMLINVPDITDKNAVNEVQSAIQNMIKTQKKLGSIAMVKDRRWTIEPNTNIIESKIDYNTREAIAREVASIFGIPPSRLGIEDNNKYNTLVERNRAYVDEAVKPILDIITTSLTDYFFESNMTNEISYRSIDLLSLDPSALKDFATSAINNAFATPNEIRELIGWEPLEEGDILMANSAIAPVQYLIDKSKVELENLKNPPKEEPQNLNENPNEEQSNTNESESENSNEESLIN